MKDEALLLRREYTSSAIRFLAQRSSEVPPFCLNVSRAIALNRPTLTRIIAAWFESGLCKYFRRRQRAFIGLFPSLLQQNWAENVLSARYFYLASADFGSFRRWHECQADPEERLSSNQRWPRVPSYSAKRQRRHAWECSVPIFESL